MRDDHQHEVPRRTALKVDRRLPEATLLLTVARLKAVCLRGHVAKPRGFGVVATSWLLRIVKATDPCVLFVPPADLASRSRLSLAVTGLGRAPLSSYPRGRGHV